MTAAAVTEQALQARLDEIRTEAQGFIDTRDQLPLDLAALAGAIYTDLYIETLEQLRALQGEPLDVDLMLTQFRALAGGAKH